MKVFVIIIQVLLTLTSAVDLTYKDCGSSATVTKAFSPECTDAVCKLRKGLHDRLI